MTEFTTEEHQALYEDFPRLKECQNDAKKILKIVHDVCVKNDIKYSLAYGTLLGAVRHGDVIPWDDDIDIMMDRENYEKYLEVSKDVLPENIINVNERTYPRRGILSTRVTDTNSNFNEGVKHNYDYPNGVWVDIFVFDSVPNSSLRRLWIKLWVFLYDTWTKKRTKHNYTKFIYKIMHWIVMLPVIIMWFFLPLKFYIWRQYKMTTKYNKKKHKYKQYTSFTRTEYNHFLDKEYFDEYDLIKFGDYKFMVIKEYKKLLTISYGDYMKLPDKNNRRPVHFDLREVE